MGGTARTCSSLSSKRPFTPHKLFAGDWQTSCFGDYQLSSLFAAGLESNPVLSVQYAAQATRLDGAKESTRAPNGSHLYT